MTGLNMECKRTDRFINLRVHILVKPSDLRLKGKVTTVLTVCPLRAKPDDASEMITQLLFGESATVLQQHKKNWTKIKLDYDGYEGWIDTKQLTKIKERKSVGSAYSLELFDTIFADKKSTWITMGAELPAYDGMISKLAEVNYRFSGQAIKSEDMHVDGELIEKLARRLINTPYLWGGRTPLGIDCSGFTQLIYKCAGLAILRDAQDQATQGETIDFVTVAQPGDLAFFTKATEKITHVGIILPDMQIIHASGHVRIDAMDHYGIYNREIEEYTHRLKIIKRYF